ncbi:MAG: hypothetical protein KC477_09730 [Oceanospirillaceae bacterium]|nr:hypothetical protein [Oceanospirillaceae bacterium]
MKIIIRVTSERDGTECYINTDNIVYFTQQDGETGTRLYFTSGEISHLIVKETPQHILQQIRQL